VFTPAHYHGAPQCDGRRHSQLQQKTNAMEQMRTTGQEILSSCETRRFIAVLTTAHHWSLFGATGIQFTQSYLWPILILSFHLYLGPPKLPSLNYKQATHINILKPKLVKIFKNSVRTSKRTPHFTITKINWLMLFKETVAVYSENHTNPINTKYSVTGC
jgi:hypothetical protein